MEALPQLGSGMAGVTFVAFDIETTGLSSRSSRVVEIAAVKFRNGKVLGQKSWFVNPGMAIPKGARRIHGITDEMVSDAPPFRLVFPRVRKFVGSAVLLAHNAGRFDARFISAELARNGMPLPSNDILDTLVLFREWFPRADSHALDAVADHVGVKIHGRHRALGDALCLYELFCRGLASLEPNVTVESFASKKGAVVHFE